mmetsp:Transcript_88353/g.239491  ORF Transcript_88353/g.239491 Transcript_88353/m.239491 type:complete len:137 (-) Transcript_88353:39-449(-)
MTTSDYQVIEELETQGTWEKVVGPMVGDVLEVCKEFTSDDASCRDVLMKPEVRGKIEEIDDDGDMKVFFPSLVKNNLPRWFGTRWVCQHHFGYFKKRTKPDAQAIAEHSAEQGRAEVEQECHRELSSGAPAPPLRS